ncbi:MAG: polysaccharide lyase family 8 super-sandwich domain-containing protein, partial [Verrucomicrobiota bacterium]
ANGHAAPHEYHETFTYTGDSNTVGGQLTILCLLMYDEFHADRQTDPAVEDVFQEVRAYLRAFINASPQIRGPNWAFRLDNCLRYIVFTNQVADMDEYDYHWKKALSFNRTETDSTGIHPDWSVMHHGEMNYWGMYGIGWTDGAIEYGELFQNTPWAYETEHFDFIADTMTEGTRWVMFRGVVNYSTAAKRATRLLDRTDSVASSFIDLYDRLLNLGGSQLTRQAEITSIRNDAFLPPWTSAGAAQANEPEFEGHRYFWNTELQAHRRANFGIWVNRCSQRARPPEDRSASGNPSWIHLNFGTGYTPIVRRGDEIRFSKLAWDFEHLPGTTVEQGQTISAGAAGSTKRGLNLFSGGVFDGDYGFGGFDLEMVQFDSNDSGSYSPINGAGALKGTFFFDDGMVALGQNIRRVATVGGSQNEILTTINNVRRLTDVTYSVNGSGATTVPLGTPLQQSFTVTSEAWFWHDGMGYVIWPSAAGGTQLVASFGDRPFNSVIEQDPDMEDSIRDELGHAAWNAGVLNMFRLWIDHGVNPVGDTYAYVVLPDVTVSELQAYVANPPVQVVANSGGVQAVSDTATGLYYSLFQGAGSVDFGAGKTLTVDRPLMVMAREQGGSYALTASNPLHRGLRRSYVPGSGATVGEVVLTPVEVNVSGFGPESEVYFSFSNERGEEGGSVKVVPGGGASEFFELVDWEFNGTGLGGVDSGLSGTDWGVDTPETVDPAWIVTGLGGGAEAAFRVEVANSRLALVGASDGVSGVSEAVLPFGVERGEGEISVDLGLNSGSTWTAAKFNLVHIGATTTTTLLDINVQRNGTNSNNLITTGSGATSISGQWEDVYNTLSVNWKDGVVDVSVTGLDTGDVSVTGHSFLGNLEPNALLLRAGSDSDTRTRILQLDRLNIQFPTAYDFWVAGYGLVGSPDSDATFDYDGDGFDNEAEFLAGTSPIDGNDYLRVESLSHSAGTNEIVIDWTSVEGRVYDIYYSKDLIEPFAMLEEGVAYPLKSVAVMLGVEGGIDSARGFFQLRARLAGP